MQLTLYTDYGLRTLILLALAPDQLQTVTSISQSYGISRNHLVKVVARLAELGYVKTARGRGGGIRLARSPGEVRVGDVVRDLECELGVVECLQKQGGSCVIAPACRLKGLLAGAMEAYMSVLDQHTIADLVRERAPMARLLGIPLVAAPRMVS
jgi:Rrf2 family transcriptional regulator, nitric oxide-sensitive transcriptional repressor